ncbi:MAG: phosphoribosylformylglycinamidine synthase I [Pirellulaceae bacterium]
MAKNVSQLVGKQEKVDRDTMASPRILIVRAPGTNCDRETSFAFEQAGGKPDLVHINRILEKPQLTKDYQILCMPGGFCYGDDIAAGRILASQIRHHLYDTINDFKSDGKLILGICNGFQVLIKSGVLLVESAANEHPATLTWNDSGRFEDRWVHLQVDGQKCVFLQDVSALYLPIAHAEGKFVTRTPTVFQQLEENQQLPLRYTTAAGLRNGQLEYPLNPNGSMGNVAGACDETGRVLGLMPHPERHIDPTHHPRWTREGLQEQGDGCVVFHNAVQYFA